MNGPEHFDPAPLPQWQADRLAMLLDTLDDVPVSDAERASLAWLAGFETATVENVAAVIRRARAVTVATRAARGEVGSGHQPTYVSHSSGIQMVVTSFGYLHGDPPKADIVVDVRDYLRDPHVDPAFRALTGHDTAVMERVLATPGAQGLIDALVAAAAALLPGACNTGRLVQIAVGCAGGRHRSVAIADAVTARLALAGWGTEAEHLHISEPVVER